MTKKKILLLSAYDARSHRYWHQSMVAQFPQYDWQVLTLKDRFFAWRMGGNAMNFSAQYEQQLKADYDVIIATSMTDLSTLLGLYPQLTRLPIHLYFHENQFAYPVNNQQRGLLEIQMRSIYAALAADFIWFNSDFNHHSFFNGISQLVQKMPDGIPTDLFESLQTKSSVLAVPIADDCFSLNNKTPTNQAIEVVWNHRWEHDKGPETLLEVLRLCTNKAAIKFHIIGQQFNTKPPAMQSIVTHHQAQCLSLGYIESRTQYIKTLQQADVVLSTAKHDFQGLAILEAVACGCKPIAPDRLVYPELYPATNLYPSNPNHPHQEAKNIVSMLCNHQQLQTCPIDCGWQQLYAAYSKLLALSV